MRAARNTLEPAVQDAHGLLPLRKIVYNIFLLLARIARRRFIIGGECVLKQTMQIDQNTESKRFLILKILKLMLKT